MTTNANTSAAATAPYVDLARALAPLLGGDWVASDSSERYDWCHADRPGYLRSAALCLHLTVACPQGQHGRVQVSARPAPRGSFPRVWNADKNRHKVVCRTEITVAGDRGPVAIAHEITRRLLDGAIPAARQAIADADAEIATRQRRDALARELAALIGRGISTSDGRAYGTAGDTAVEIEVRLSSDPAGAVALRLRSITAAQARKVVALLVDGAVATADIDVGEVA